jgi:hypothetical protein
MSRLIALAVLALVAAGVGCSSCLDDDQQQQQQQQQQQNANPQSSSNKPLDPSRRFLRSPALRNFQPEASPDPPTGADP